MNIENMKIENIEVHKLASGYAISGQFKKDDGTDVYARCLYSDSTLYDDWTSENADSNDWAKSRAVAILESEIERLASGKVYPGEAYEEF